MKTAKEEIQDLLDTLPDDVSLDEIARRLQFRARMLHSRDQALRGELIPHEDVLKDLHRWQQSAHREMKNPLTTT